MWLTLQMITIILEALGNQVNLPTMEAGGLDVAWFIVYTSQGELTAEGFNNAYRNAIGKFEAIHRLTEEIAPDKNWSSCKF